MRKINERSRETNFNWDVSSSLNAGKFLPNDWKVTLPLFYNYGQTIITPLFNPLDPAPYAMRELAAEAGAMMQGGDA